MRFLVNYGKVYTVLLFLFPLLGLSASYLYLQYDETKKEIVEIVKDSMLDKKYELLDIYIEYLETEFGKDFITTLKNSKEMREKAEQSLSLMKNSEVQYLYLLYIDTNNHLRYLLDTTADIDEKGEFAQRFIPQKSIWEKAQEGRLPTVTAQKEIDKLWITMAYPIIYDSNTVALLGIDFSHKEHIEVKKTLIPLENIYIYSAVFVIVMLISAFIQLIIYYLHRKKSFIDPLTGMYNRQYLYELLKKYPTSAFHILLMDLDHFKQVNDIYGHDSGDIVLETVSKRIHSVIRKKDILIRYGGEEFILLIASKDVETSMQLAQKIRIKVKEIPVSLEKCQLKVTISMGLNQRPQESKTFEEAVKVADLGLYKAKQLGRDRVEIYDEVNSHTDVQQQMCAVKEALDLDKLFCLYQPIYDVKSMHIEKYELLIRMLDENNNVVNPADFLPPILHTQVYIHLTIRVLEFAHKTLQNSDEHLSINLDLQDLFNDEIMESIFALFANNRTLANRLCIELLEDEKLSEYTSISNAFEKLKSIGITIAISRFGSGFATYNYLLNTAIDTIKIDASLIANIDTNENAQTIFKSIVFIATNMGIKTVAEHIETKEELACVKELGIDYVQGFYLAKPTENFISS